MPSCGFKGTCPLNVSSTVIGQDTYENVPQNVSTGISYFWEMNHIFIIHLHLPELLCVLFTYELNMMKMASFGSKWQPGLPPYMFGCHRKRSELFFFLITVQDRKNRNNKRIQTFIVHETIMSHIFTRYVFFLNLAPSLI